MRRLLTMILILCMLSASAFAFDITAPFKGIKASIGNDVDKEQWNNNPMHCVEDGDCEWRNCGCFNKDSDKHPDRCLININIDGCLCMENTCVPDIMSLLGDYEGVNIRSYQRRFMFKPECPDSEFIFFNSPKLPETHLLVLAMKGNDNFNDFLEENCGSKDIEQRFDDILGGEYFDPCNGLDFAYNDCASFKVQNCNDWLDQRQSIIDEKAFGCIEDFKDCSFYEETIDRMARMKDSCKDDPEELVKKCDSCDLILLAKNKCESQEINKIKFKEDALTKVKILCDLKENKLEKSRKLLLDDELAMDIAEQELHLASVKKDVKKFNKDILKAFTYKIKRALRLADESDNPEVRKSSMLDALIEIQKEIERLSIETDNSILSESKVNTISEIEELKESLN